MPPFQGSCNEQQSRSCQPFPTKDGCGNHREADLDVGKVVGEDQLSLAEAVFGCSSLMRSIANLGIIKLGVL